jgi:potassium-transporting ATPase KdpC subunit
MKYLSKSIWLLSFSVLVCCVIYPAALWVVGQVVFPFQANGSLLHDAEGHVIGSQLIAQPFTKDEYFQPRPSACTYDASASASSSLAASNYALRNRVATALGPIVTYKGGPKGGQAVAPDIESWFQQDRYQGSPLIVAQWADSHNSLAQAWVSADPSHAPYVSDWAKAHPAIVAQFIKDNPGTANPQPADLAVVFFKTFSKENPGKFPSAVPVAAPATATASAIAPASAPAAAPATVIQPVDTGSDIQSIFFDMWRQDHPDAELQDVPGDMLTTSGSGLDPHITLQNAEFQLDRVASKWATDSKRDLASVRAEIEQILQNNASAPFGGLAGEKFVNVLQVNLTLCQKYGSPS